MSTLAINNTEKTKKLIELPNDICRHLALQAAVMGTSVKRLIENLVISSIDVSNDEALYAYLCKICPDGNIALSEDEQSELLKRMEKKASKK